ncbi:MAG: glycosyltransferase family 39 protein [Deltaproteobacteria bacterium]|nr:glycosyltransferase family 39 protein [Deltaproteobacteria bacterium]
MTWAWCIQAGFVVAIAVYWLAALWAAPFDPNYTSSELYDWLVAWVHGTSLYQAPLAPPYRVVNYPPGFAWLARVGLAAGLSPLWAGRAASGVGLAVVLGLLWRWGRAVGLTRGAAWALLGVLGSSFYVLFSLGQAQLQWPAVACSLAGMYLLRAPQQRRQVAAAGCLLTLACFIKQTQCLSALIGLLWVWRRYRPWLQTYVVAAVVTALSGAALLTLVWGGEVWRHTVSWAVGSPSLVQCLQTLYENLLPWSGWCGLGIWLASRRPAARQDLRWWYFAGSSVWWLASVRQGIAGPNFLEWSCATLLWVWPQVRNPDVVCRAVWARRSLCGLLVVQLLAADVIVVGRIVYSAERLRRDVAQLPALCAVLPSAPGLIVTEDVAVVRQCGREPASYPFIMANLARRGLWDETAFVTMLRAGAFPALLLPFAPPTAARWVQAQRWTEAMRLAMAEGYRLHATIGRWYLLVPRARDLDAVAVP